MVLLLGVTAMAVDFGYILLEKQRLNDALDAAALAGAQDLMVDSGQAKITAEQYALKNGINNLSITVDQGNKEITVNGEKSVPFFFAKALGFEQKNIFSTVKAKINPIASGSGFVPIGIVQQDFIYGELYDLKYGPGDGYNGNYGALALGGSGASNYKNNLMYGYQGKLEIGMIIPTETGNMSGPTKTGIEYRMNLDSGKTECDSYSTAARDCSRIVFLPVIDSLEGEGRTETTIVGFAAFYLEGVLGNGNESIIQGRFLKTVSPGDWDQSGENDFGLYAVKLVY